MRVDHEEYYREHAVHYIQAQCSTAHTFGNVTAFIQNWLINLFPENTFNTIHVNSKIAHTQMRSVPKEFLKKKCPMFIIKPRIDWTANDKFLKGTMLIERQGDLYSTYGGTNLQDFFMDGRREVAMKYQMNRHVMNFDVALIFNTYIQQINWANYFLNAVRQEIPFNLQTCLESYISPKMMEQLSKCVNIPIKDEHGGNQDFLRYLNSHSSYPITYKLQGSTNSEEYYRYYPVNIDTIITGFNVDDGEKVGQVNSRYQIQFSIRCEFYSTGFYYLFSDKLKNQSVIAVDKEDSNIIPIFTDVLTKEDIDLPLGWTLYASPSCRLETPNDVLDIGSLFNDSLRASIKYHTDRGMTMMDFLKIRVRKQGKLLQYGKDYDIDFNTFKLNFYNCDVYCTYKILLMINVEYINNLIKSVYNLP